MMNVVGVFWVILTVKEGRIRSRRRKIAHWSKRSWIGHAETGYRLRSGEGAPSSEECTSIYAFRMQCDQMWPKRGGVVAPGLSITNWASPMVLSANPPSQ